MIVVGFGEMCHCIDQIAVSLAREIQATCLMTLHQASGPSLLQQAICDWITLPAVADCSSKFTTHILLVTAACG